MLKVSSILRAQPSRQASLAQGRNEPTEWVGVIPVAILGDRWKGGLDTPAKSWLTVPR
jgi:hypothetical protein